MFSLKDFDYLEQHIADETILQTPTQDKELDELIKNASVSIGITDSHAININDSYLELNHMHLD